MKKIALAMVSLFLVASVAGYAAEKKEAAATTTTAAVKVEKKTETKKTETKKTILKS